MAGMISLLLLLICVTVFTRLSETVANGIGNGRGVRLNETEAAQPDVQLRNIATHTVQPTKCGTVG